MRQSNASKTPSSGTSDAPPILPYPPVTHLDKMPEIKGRLVYIIEGYALDGVSVLLFFRDGNLGMKIGDWDGHTLTEEQANGLGINLHVGQLSNLMIRARIPQAQFYFSTNGKLVDIRTHLDHMVGPGMLKDLCSKVVPTQDIIDIQQLTEEIEAGIDRYVILKHSSFKVIVRGDKMVPMYAIAGV